MIRKGCAAGLVLLAACAGAPRPAVPEGRVERRVMLMGTSLEIEVEAHDRAAALAASEAAVAALEAAEDRLSTWRPDSELARLNRAPVGERVLLSPRLAAELAATRRWWRETGGAFDPAVGPLVKAWGLRDGGRLPSPAERAAAVAASGMDGLRLEDGVAIRERAGLILEEGAWGKGAGLGDALAALAADPAVTRATLDLGGQVALFSRTRTGVAPWTVPVADPRRRDRVVAELTVDGGSVSTSGNSEHGITAGGRTLGHLLDPRRGEPAPDFGSLTVWTADPLTADCLSTGLYVIGPEAAMDWAADHPGVEVLVLRPREALATPGLSGRLKALDPEIRVRFWKSSRANAA
jgi:thiamine biosynthesis lipoprotein